MRTEGQARLLVLWVIPDKIRRRVARHSMSAEDPSWPIIIGERILRADHLNEVPIGGFDLPRTK